MGEGKGIKMKLVWSYMYCVGVAPLVFSVPEGWGSLLFSVMVRQS